MIDQKTIIKNIPNSLETINLPKNFGKKHQGKVRDLYILKDSPRTDAGKRAFITTDRQSAFDKVLGLIPFKGQVLTAISAFWFEKTKDIIQNHIIKVADPNVLLVRNCKVLPIEVVVRGYITGVTDTSIWGSYEKGERTIYGIKFPDGLKKNQKLKKPVITPTTKAETGKHDQRLTEKEILQNKIVPPKIWKEMKKVALALFARGQKICDKAGIILVDTKYEFGLDENGKLILIDEIHTPDSSRYWVKKTYRQRFKKGLEPESYDKEPLRIWFKERGYTGEGKIPKMPPLFLAKMSMLYMGIYEKITGKKFIPDLSKSPEKRIRKNLEAYFMKNNIDKPGEKCAVFGIYDHNTDVARITYYALYGLQHRGQESSGIALSNGKRFKMRRGMGLVRDVFKKEKHIDRLGKGFIAVGHNRYSTTGSSHICNAQPFLIEKDGRQIIIAHNGNIVNTEELKAKVKEIKLNSTTDTEVVGALLLESKKATWEERFDEVLPQVEGAYSFVISTRDLLFGIRDPYGVRPLVIGEINGGWVLSSEDCVFPGIGAKFIREIEPGEAVIIDKNGPKTFYKQKIKNRAFCIFEYVYFARPDSTFHGYSVGKVREKCGEILAEEAPIDADMVMPVPDSGITAAIAYAKKSGIPLGEGVIKNRYIGRTFIQPDQRLRELGVKIKFGPMSANLKDKRVIVVDDSIVRGTTMRGFVKLLRDYGAKEVHIRVACPPLTNPCYYGVDFPTKEELIANRFSKNSKEINVEKIHEFIGSDSLAYLSIKGLLKAAGIEETRNKDFNIENTPYCIACMSGNYKIKLKENQTKKDVKKLAILISNVGPGTNLQAIIDAVNSRKINAKIAVVVSDTSNAPGLDRARRHNIDIEICRSRDNLLPLLKEKYPVDYVCLTGWKQIIPEKFIKAFQNKILNAHPGIIADTIDGIFKNPDGTPAIWNKGKMTNKAIQNVLDKKATFAGSSIHILTKTFDFGPVLGRCFEKVQSNDTIDSLYARLKVKENQMYVDVLKKLCSK